MPEDILQYVVGPVGGFALAVWIIRKGFETLENVQEKHKQAVTSIADSHEKAVVSMVSAYKAEAGAWREDAKECKEFQKTLVERFLPNGEAHDAAIPRL